MNEQKTNPRGNWTSASNAEADSLCAGRHQAQIGLPEVQGGYADTGSRIHAALAKGSSEGLELAEVETYDLCLEIEAQKLNEFFGDDVGKAKKFVEERIWLPGEPKFQHSGQPDRVWRFGPKALIPDFKVLLGEHPESSKNKQLRDYAVLVYGKMIGLTQIGTVVIQPLVTRKPAICIYEQPDLLRAAEEMFQRIVNSNSPDAKRTAGETQCKFCKAKSSCVEYQRFAGALMPLVAEPVVQAGLFQVAMSHWTPEQRAVAAEMVSPALKALEEINEFLKDGLTKSPAFIPGWGLSKGRVTEKVTDPQACFDRFSAIGGDIKKFMGTVTVGKTRLREAIHDVTGAKGKQLDKAIDALTEGIVSSSTSAPSLVKLKEGA